MFPSLVFPETLTTATPRILLHACCAPCSSAIINCLLANKLEVEVYFCNPNIYPEKEYLIRKNEIKRFLNTLSIPFIDADESYQHLKWRKHIEGFENEPERGHRCQLCFNYRLNQTAAYASTHHFHLFTTTLASSRWKDLNQITLAGREAARLHPPAIYWEQNWRKGGLTELRAKLLKENQFYNQEYCGCEFSLQQRIEHQRKKEG